MLQWMMLAVLTGIVLPCRAGDPRMVLPDDDRVEDVKSPADFFGFEIGSRHLRHDQVHAYLLYLAEHSDRASAIHYGHTHGGRPLSVLAISAPIPTCMEPLGFSLNKEAHADSG